MDESVIKTIAAVAGIVFAIGGVVNTWFTVSIKLELSKLKLQITKEATLERDLLKAWVEREFMRKPEVEAKFKHVETQIEHLHGLTRKAA